MGEGAKGSQRCHKTNLAMMRVYERFLENMIPETRWF
jgi:hypothetical protein